LLNAVRGTNIEIFYWRERSQEVDFVLKKGDVLCAIEVKSSIDRKPMSKMETFVKLFNPQRVLLVGKQGLTIEEFLQTPIEDLF